MLQAGLGRNRDRWGASMHCVASIVLIHNRGQIGGEESREQSGMGAIACKRLRAGLAAAMHWLVEAVGRRAVGALPSKTTYGLICRQSVVAMVLLVGAKRERYSMTSAASACTVGHNSSLSSQPPAGRLTGTNVLLTVPGYQWRTRRYSFIPCTMHWALAAGKATPPSGGQEGTDQDESRQARNSHGWARSKCEKSASINKI